MSAGEWIVSRVVADGTAVEIERFSVRIDGSGYQDCARDCAQMASDLAPGDIVLAVETVGGEPEMFERYRAGRLVTFAETTPAPVANRRMSEPSADVGTEATTGDAS